MSSFLLPFITFLQCRAGAGQLCLGPRLHSPLQCPWDRQTCPSSLRRQSLGAPGSRGLGQRLVGPWLQLQHTQEEHFSSEGLSVPSCSELRLDVAVVVTIPGVAALWCFPRSSSAPCLPCPALSITFITPCSLINREESKDPKAMIVINNRLATAELLLHQGLLLASRRGKERREDK